MLKNLVSWGKESQKQAVTRQIPEEYERVNSTGQWSFGEGGGICKV